MLGVADGVGDQGDRDLLREVRLVRPVAPETSPPRARERQVVQLVREAAQALALLGGDDAVGRGLLREQALQSGLQEVGGGRVAVRSEEGQPPSTPDVKPG